LAVASIVTCNSSQQSHSNLPRAVSDIPPPTTGKLQYIGSFLLSEHGVYWRMLWLTEEMDFISPCVLFVFRRMLRIGLLLVRCFALLLKQERESFMPIKLLQGNRVETLEKEANWDSNVASTASGTLCHVGK